jgi:secreted trypsin-like serine protease
MKFILFVVLIFIAATRAQFEDAIHSVDSEYFNHFWGKPSHANKFNRTGRITGGAEAARFQFPHQVGLLLTRPDGQYLCGGSLISKNFILTAAHCLEGVEKAQVNLGAHRLHGNDASWRATFPKQNFIIHEDYNSNFIWNDIALIRVVGVVLTPGEEIFVESMNFRNLMIFN